MNILQVAKKLNIEIYDAVSEIFFDVELSKNFDLDEINQEIDNINYNGRLDEYADSNTPIYYSDIDASYDKQTASNRGYSIDDAISEGFFEAMESEGDISRAKQVALYMQIEQDAMQEIETFKDEINEKYDSVFDDSEES